LILIADDSPIIQRKAQRILQDGGFEVETVSNGVAAIKRVPVLRPILLLADVSMPGKDGYEVCEFVKASPDLIHIPVLLVGSDLEPYDEQRGAQVKADGIIKKPFTPSDLMAMVTKFTGLGEASGLQPASAEWLAESSPVALPEVPPTALVPEPSTKSQELAPLPAGVSFIGPSLEELPANLDESLSDDSFPPSPDAAPRAWPEPSPEPQIDLPPEDVLEGSSEPLIAPTRPFPRFAPGLPSEPAPEPIPEAAPEPGLVSPESSREVEASCSGGAEINSSTSQSVDSLTRPILAPEAAVVGPELISEAASEVARGPNSLVAEPTPEPIPVAAPEEALVIPDLVSEITPEAVSEKVGAGTAASAGGEFDSSTSRLLDSSTPRRLDSFVIDTNWLYMVVRKVVMKMAPPVLAPDIVEELVRTLTREIAVELEAASSQVH
jgi:CheY-like chemotaxis protein